MARKKKGGDEEEKDDREAEEIAMDVAGFPPEVKRQAIWLRVNMTGFEKSVWKMLGADENQWGFLRQWPMDGYFLDFYSAHFKVALEADGPDHIKQKDHDRERDKVLAKRGVRTIRLTPADFKKASKASLLEYLINAIENTDE